MSDPKDRDIPFALATVFAAAVLSTLSATNASAWCPDSALYGSDDAASKHAIEGCREKIADETERLNQANGWLAHLEADAKMKPYLDPVEQSQLQEAKNDVATKSFTLEDDKRHLDDMEHPKPLPPPPTPEEQAAAKAAQAESAAREAERERQGKLAACNSKPTSLGVLFCRWGSRPKRAADLEPQQSSRAGHRGYTAPQIPPPTSLCRRGRLPERRPRGNRNPKRRWSRRTHK